MSRGPAWDRADASAVRLFTERFSGAPIAVGLAGAQGSGKTTMAGRLVERLAAVGLRGVVLALDDFYLTRAERSDLARAVHPLLATRGVPGTHDVPVLEQVIAQLTSSHSGTVAVPRFDKAADDRVARDDWRDLTGPFDVVLLEGWCVGARPQPRADLQHPTNTLEGDEDADGRWRTWVNDRLATDYAALADRLATSVFLRAPGFDVVLQWRTEQERGLNTAGMNEAQLRRFVAHYERITRWMLADQPADLVIGLDHARTPLMPG